jgi:uncharacterized protein YegL
MEQTWEGPGGQITSRPLYFFWIVDCSGSMGFDGKIQALNNAITEAVPHMKEIAENQPHADVQIRVLAFSSGAQWIAQSTPVAQFRWTDLGADGETDLGRALSMVADELRVPPMSDRALPPVLVLISDGQPTDDYRTGLDQLMREPWGRKAVRLAIAIGRDADLDVLSRFIGNPEIRPLAAHSPEELVHYIKWASTIVAPVSQPRPAGGEIPIQSPPPPPVRSPDVTW